jgi:radical SAM superfamily enzyme YgiQ (UPF0313 family)
VTSTVVLPYLPQKPMRDTAEVVLINPPREPSSLVRAPTPAPGHVPNTDRIHSDINLGLLCLANSLQKRSHSVRVLDLEGQSEFLEQAVDFVCRAVPRVVGISCLFHSTYLATQSLVACIRAAFPDVWLVAGGTHIGCFPDQALREIPGLDAICAGEAEESLSALIELPPDRWHRLPGVHTQSGGAGRSQAPSLDHSLEFGLYPRAFERVCVLEESRGCPGRCSFCHHTRQLRERPLSVLREELTAYLAHASSSEREVTVASDTCGLNWPRLEGLLRLLAELQSVRPFRWGAQTRADATGFLHPDAAALAMRSGLTSLSVGLESGSPDILRSMDKAAHPERYLAAAGRLLDGFGGRAGLSLRLNVLLYAGETARTAEHTRAFLRRHRGGFEGIHAAVLHAYPGTAVWDELPLLRERHGTTCVRTPYWESVHAFPVNPSASLDFEQAQALALALRTEFNRMQPQ